MSDINSECFVRCTNDVAEAAARSLYDDIELMYGGLGKPEPSLAKEILADVSIALEPSFPSMDGLVSDFQSINALQLKKQQQARNCQSIDPAP
ncbi:MAG: hypothetical protein C0507_05560 [Cyanobacteria bacterium PR.3.49]|nr:hypothetical protein [Cyanobacteria bacterium PR.3.49]